MPPSDSTGDRDAVVRQVRSRPDTDELTNTASLKNIWSGTTSQWSSSCSIWPRPRSINFRVPVTVTIDARVTRGRQRGCRVGYDDRRVTPAAAVDSALNMLMPCLMRYNYTEMHAKVQNCCGIHNFTNFTLYKIPGYWTGTRVYTGYWNTYPFRALVG